MKTIICILTIFLTVTFPRQELKAQVFDIKSWRGDYPEMNGSYPLSFVAFKGWLIPIPHVFIRTVPTHYYVKAGVLPVYDAAGYADLLRINFLKIVSRLIEKSQMEARHEETSQIRDNMQTQKDIEKKIFDAESDHLGDVYSIASGFVRLYISISRLEKLENCRWLKELCEKEADELLTRFISVNLFRSGHGKKLEAFAEIRSELNRQIGDVDYTYRKVHHYQFYLKDTGRSYAFLSE